MSGSSPPPRIRRSGVRNQELVGYDYLVEREARFKGWGYNNY
jgi:hypothetical protein